MFAELCLEKVGLLEAYGAPYGLAALEEYEGGHRTDVILQGQGVVLVDVDLEDVGLVADTLFYFLEDGGLHTAGSAPGGEEIDKRGLVIIDELVEVAHNFLWFKVYSLGFIV